MWFPRGRTYSGLGDLSLGSGHAGFVGAGGARDVFPIWDSPFSWQPRGKKNGPHFRSGWREPVG